MRRMAIVALVLAAAACAASPSATTVATTLASTVAASPSTEPAAAPATTVDTAATTSTGPGSTTTSPVTTTTGAATSTTAAATSTVANTTSSSTTTAPTTSTVDQPKTVDVEVFNFGFRPVSVTVHVGDRVRWTVTEGSHTTTSGTSPTSDGVWNSPALGPSQSFAHTMTAAGTFSYFCGIHPGMTGTVVVEP